MGAMRTKPENNSKLPGELDATTTSLSRSSPGTAGTSVAFKTRCRQMCRFGCPAAADEQGHVYAPGFHLVTTAAPNISLTYFLATDLGILLIAASNVGTQELPSQRLAA